MASFAATGADSRGARIGGVGALQRIQERQTVLKIVRPGEHIGIVLKLQIHRRLLPEMVEQEGVRSVL